MARVTKRRQASHSRAPGTDLPSRCLSLCLSVSSLSSLRLSVCALSSPSPPPPPPLLAHFRWLHPSCATIRVLTHSRTRPKASCPASEGPWTDLASEHFVEEHTQGPPVHRRAIGFLVDDFWGDVVGCPVDEGGKEYSVNTDSECFALLRAKSTGQQRMESRGQ